MIIKNEKPQAQPMWEKRETCTNCGGTGEHINYGPKQIEFVEGDEQEFAEYVAESRKNVSEIHRSIDRIPWLTFTGAGASAIFGYYIFFLVKGHLLGAGLWLGIPFAPIAAALIYGLCKQPGVVHRARSRNNAIAVQLAGLLLEYGVKTGERWTIDCGKTEGFIDSYRGEVQYPIRK